MERWTSFVPVLFIFIINSANSIENHYGNKKTLEDTEIYRILPLLEPSNLLKNYVISQKFAENDTCTEDLSRLKDALLNITIEQNLNMWPYQMLDASSKIPSGLLDGNLVDLGMYDECLAIRGDSDIRGQHCMYGIQLLGTRGYVPMELKLSICLPSSCSDSDVAEFLNSTIQSIMALSNITIPDVIVTCSPVDPEIWDTEFIICVCILVIFVAFLCMCTICEIISERHDKFSKNKTMINLTQFSLKKNVNAIFNMKLSKGNLPVLHGIRFISMAWIVLGHEFMHMVQFPLTNKLHMVNQWLLEWNSLYVFTAQYAVDTFFVISGFLLSYIFLKQKTFNLPLYYLHRIIRLTPAIIALFFFFVVFVPKLGSGPLWHAVIDTKTEICREKWWPTFLYVQNFVYQDECLGHLWYLAVDMQLFWISPIILYPLQRKPKIGLFILTAFFIASIVTPAVIIAVNNYHIASYLKLEDPMSLKEMFNEIYITPYTRAAPWLMGIFLGFETVSKKDRKPTKFVIYFGWFLAIGGFAFCTFFARYFLRQDYTYNVALESVYTAASRAIWGFGVCWIIYTSIHDCGGLIVKFLSSRIFLPFSRISYCMYLVHMIVELMQVSAFRTVRYFSDYYVWYYCLGDFAITIVVAVLFSLLFESPILVVDKLIFKRPKKSTSEPQKELTNEAISDQKKY